jgi:hypothetical protein
LFARGHDGLASGAAAVRIAAIQVGAELGGDDHAIALARRRVETITDDRFGVPLGVAVGGVDEIAAAIEESQDLRFLDGDPQPQSSPKVIVPRQKG